MQFTLIITHSRPIHVAVVEMDSQELERRLSRYRPNMHVVHLTDDWTKVKEGVHMPYLAASRVRKLLGTGGDDKAIAASA